MKFAPSSLLAAAVLMTLAGTVQAQIVWETPQSITGPSDISTAGKFIAAMGLDNGGNSPYQSPLVTGPITIGDTAFLPVPSSTQIVPGGPYAYYGTDGSGSNATPYQSVLNDVIYVGFSPSAVSATITLNGLTVNAGYQVQVWNPGGRLTDISGGGNTVTLSHEYTLGYFTATGTSQTFDFTSFPNNAGEISAVSLRVVPEPSTYAMLLAGLAVLGLCVRRKNVFSKL